MARKVDAERVAQRREAILVASGRLFATKGFERTTVADIAKAAGLSAGSVFYYFPDKRAVFRGVFARDLPMLRRLVARFVDADQPLAAILELVTELAADARDPNASGLLVELLRQADQDPELLGVVGRNMRVVREGLAGLVARGIADGTVDPVLVPKDAAGWIQTVIDAVFLTTDPARDPVPMLRRTVERYLAPPRGDERGNDGDNEG